VPTGIWTARRRTRRRWRRRRRTALIKSNNPHLAGGEIIFFKDSNFSGLGVCCTIKNIALGFLILEGIEVTRPFRQTYGVCAVQDVEDSIADRRLAEKL
jgi:hypothetical protein